MKLNILITCFILLGTSVYAESFNQLESVDSTATKQTSATTLTSESILAPENTLLSLKNTAVQKNTLKPKNELSSKNTAVQKNTLKPKNVTAGEKIHHIEPHIQVHVKGLVCSFCAQGVKKGFKAHGSIKSIRFNSDFTRIDVFLLEGKSISNDEVTQIVTDAGYLVESIEREAKKENQKKGNPEKKVKK